MEAIQITNILYLISAVAFILGIKRLSHPKTARSGNLIIFIRNVNSYYCDINISRKRI